MARRKKEIVIPHLNDCGGDLTKKWYVEYSIRNPKTDKMERVRTYEDINRFSTREERYESAQKIIESYSKEIQSGSISYQEFVEYEDLLLYDGQSSFSKTRMAKVGSIKVYLSDFLQIKKLEVSPKSMNSYISKLRLFCFWAEKQKIIDKPVTYFTNDIIADFLRYIVEQKELSRVTILKYEQILHAFFLYLKKKKIIIENPVFDIPKIGVIKDESPAAIPEYMRKILQQKIETEDPQLWMFICFIYYMANLWQQEQIRVIKNDRDAYRQTSYTLLDNIDSYRTKDSLNAVSVGEMQLKLSELNRFRSDDMKLIETLNLDKNRLQKIATTQTKTTYQLQATVVDSIYIDHYIDHYITDTLRCITIHDKWFDLQGCIDANSKFAGSFENRDSLLYVEHIIPKKFLFIKWGCKERRQEIVSRNPHTLITGAEYITVRK